MNLLNALKSIISCILIIFFFSCKTTSNTQEKNPTKYISKVDSIIAKLYKDGQFNGNILIAKNDTIVYKKSFGYTNASEEAKLNDKSILNIGSIGKEFNGVAIMMLQERGLLNIHDTISKFDLELPDWSEKVTISHLLNYVSGITKIDIKNYPRNDDEAWKIIRNVDTLLFEPGTNFNYDNSNVFLQKRIIEKVTGQSFEKFIIENIVNPLKMTSAVFDPKISYANRTNCYSPDKVSCPEFEFISGWLWTDINDLHKWIQAMNSNKIISQKSFDILLKNPYVDGKTGSIGEYFETMKLQRHDGSSMKFRSVYLNDFKNNITIILFSNNRYNVIPTAHIIHNIMLDKPYKSVRQAIEKDCLKDVDLGINAYYNLKNSNTADEYMFENPSELNGLGYQLLSLERNQDAIKIFQLMISEFPDNANSYDSLGEVYLVGKQYNLALKNYKKAVELGGTNGNAEIMIKKINSIIKHN